MPSPFTINLLYDLNSEEIRRKVQGLEAWLASVRSAVSPFSEPQHVDLRQPLRHADLNVHVELPVLAAIPWAHANVLLKNPDRWSEGWDSSLWSFNTVVPVGQLTAEGLEGLFQAAEGRRPTKGVFHCPPILTVEDCPPISIVTPTYNRAKLIEIAFHNILSTDYPKDRIEWILIEDSDPDTVVPAAKEAILKFQVSNPTLAVKYIPIQGRMSIGQKRNIAIEHATHDIVLFMDDDDHYPPTSFRRRVAWLEKGFNGKDCDNDVSVCTTIALYDLIRGVSAVNVPPWGLPFQKRISEATLTFRKSVWRERPFEDVSIAEGEAWLEGRTHRCIEIPPQQIIVAFSHRNNVSDRRIPPLEVKEIACFWNFPKEYLVFIHELAGMEVDDGEKKKKGVKA